MNNIEIIIANTVEEVLSWLQKGYEAIECSIGGRSLGTYDHHASNVEGEDKTHLPAVAKQAAMKVFEDGFKFISSFVTLGAPDADATFCVYLLSGLWKEGRTPPSVEFLKSMANYVALMDVDPIGRFPANDGEVGKLWLLWEAMTANNPKDDALSFYLGVAAWRNIMSAHSRFKELTEAAVLRDQNRIKLAEQDMVDAHYASQVGNYLILDQSKVFGFDVWYGRDQSVEADNVTAWKYPVVVALTDKGNITIGCPNERIAETLFGKGGLTNLFQKLGEGWGGRGSVGGSPRGAIMTTNDLSRICDILSSYF